MSLIENNEVTRLNERLNAIYRKKYSHPFHQSFLGGGYSNFGFWNESTRDGLEAGDNLVDKLLSFIPCKKGNILDVACGQGGTTKRLMDTYSPSNITAINISREQLDAAGAHAPGCNFLLMDAAKLEFDDESFDNIICVEAVFHFYTRETFLKEAYRVLKPGGFLVLSDILVTTGGKEIPVENIVPLAKYKDFYLNAGFETPTVIDVRKQAWETFRSNYLKHARTNLKGMERVGMRMKLWFMNKILKNYLLVSACKTL
jgi:MPBQ/MSBQ methyltransferase